MVCIAAFIILCLLSVFVGFLSLFNRRLGSKYWMVFQKAWHCIFKKVRLQKCDTNFKEDVKNTLLKRVVLKQPKLLKPLSALIEALSVAIVFITVWSLVISVKSLLALWVFGTCNVSQPSQCGLGSEVCSIDQVEPTDLLGKVGRGFSEWGEIFSAIPDRLKTWRAKEYLTTSSIPLFDLSNEDSSHPNVEFSQTLLNFYTSQTVPESTPVAVDVVDPGCTVCMQSYRNQKQSGFFKQYFTVANLYAIPKPGGDYKFENSKIITDYLNSLVYFIQDYLRTSQLQGAGSDFTKLDNKQQAELSTLLRLPTKMIDRLYHQSKNNRNYIDLFNFTYDHETALQELSSWAQDFGLNQQDCQFIASIIQSKHNLQTSSHHQLTKNISTSNTSQAKTDLRSRDNLKSQITKQLASHEQEIKSLVEDKIRAKGIPVAIYSNKKHNGLFKI